MALAVFLGQMARPVSRIYVAHRVLSCVLDGGIFQSRVSELCKTQGGTKVYVSPEAYRQMIGEAEWQRLYAMNQSVYAGDKESYLHFAGKGYTPVAQRTPRVRAFRFRQEIDGIHETDMLFYDEIS